MYRIRSATRKTLRKVLSMSGLPPVHVTPGCAHAGSLHPIAEHANRRKPRLAGVVPKIAILPVEHFVAGLVEIVAEQADERLGRRDRFAGRERLLVAGDFQLDRDGAVRHVAGTTRPSGRNSPSRRPRRRACPWPAARTTGRSSAIPFAGRRPPLPAARLPVLQTVAVTRTRPAFGAVQTRTAS